MAITAGDIALLSACAFLGNIGKAVTGFGQTIIFLFVWNIGEVAGFDAHGGFKYALFIQALSMIVVQPIELYQASVIEFAHRRLLLLFVPITLVSTPLGQLLSEYIPTKTVQAVAGVLVGFVALWELYNKRKFFMGLCSSSEEEEEEEEGKGEEKKENEEGMKVKDPGGGAQDTTPANEGGSSNQDAGDERDKIASSSKPRLTSIMKDPNASLDEEIDAAPLATFCRAPLHESGKSIRFRQTGNKLEFVGDEDPVVGEGESIPSAEECTPGAKEFEDDIVTTDPPDDEEAPPIEEDTPPVEQKEASEVEIGLNKWTFWTLVAGWASGFLGGLVAIFGPPLIFYFLHPPKPIQFNKKTQRATATVISFFNVLTRQCFYVANTAMFSCNSEKLGYCAEDWMMCVFVIPASIAGTLAGNIIFLWFKDSQATIKSILAILLLLSAIGLLFSAFRE